MSEVHSRLVDYVCIVGLGKNDVSLQKCNSGVLQPQLLKQYPEQDHKVSKKSQLINTDCSLYVEWFCS